MQSAGHLGGSGLGKGQIVDPVTNSECSAMYDPLNNPRRVTQPRTHSTSFGATYIGLEFRFAAITSPYPLLHSYIGRSRLADVEGCATPRTRRLSASAVGSSKKSSGDAASDRQMPDSGCV